MFVNLLLLLTATLNVGAARADLVRAANARKNMTTMSASYVQQRTTLLSKKPLKATGTLHYRNEPTTVALHVDQPRRSLIRLTPKLYEVYRPKKNTLERFELKTDTWTTLLTRSMSAQIQKLEKHFTIVSSSLSEGPEVRRTIVMRPRDKKLKTKVKELSLVIDTKRYLVHRLSFTDHSGDQVTFELRDHKLNPKLADALFTIPKNDKTRVITHK